MSEKLKRKVKPLNVSPLIRTSRYISFFSGIVYGVIKLGTLKTYEMTAKPRREKMYKEEHEREYVKTLNLMRRDLKNVGDEMNIPDIPPGWEQDVY